jgi:lipoprotein-anchoring transpeptidase ErfK/SrfK
MDYRIFAFVAALLLASARPDNASAQYSQSPQAPWRSPLSQSNTSNPGYMVVPGDRDHDVRPPSPIAANPSVNEVRPPASIGPDPNVTGNIGSRSQTALPPELRSETGPHKELQPEFRRKLVDYRTAEPAGTIVIDTATTYLYLVHDNGKAIRYGIGVGREGFTWSGSERISKMAAWPDWHPPNEMIEREPYLPRFMAGGEGNPLGARALYLGKSLYRIHGTNQPSTIGTFVSSGCIRLTNADITDLYSRVQVGSRVVVLAGTPLSAARPSRPQ